MYGQAISMGPSTLFEISTKELIELGELHADIMHVILAWLAQKVAQSAESLIVTSSSSSPSVTLKEKQIKNFSSPKLSKSVAGSQALTHRKTEPSRSRALST
jgi:hypothetical protein